MNNDDSSTFPPLPEEGFTLPKVQLPDNIRMMHLVDVLLKTPQQFFEHIRSEQPLLHYNIKLILLSFIGLAIYGVIMGSFTGGVQWVAVPIKIIVGTTISALLCYPSLYILAALSGADLRPAQIATLLSSALALTAILLLGFAPIAFVFTFSIQTLEFMGTIHLLLGFGSLYFGVRYLAQGLEAMDSQDSSFIKFWLVVFVVTLLQMSTTLRPILGQEDYLLTSEKKFFLVHWSESLEKLRR